MTIQSANLHHSDRNFDPIADHFAKKVYGGLKGQIRLAILERDISQMVEALSDALNRPLRILGRGARKKRGRSVDFCARNPYNQSRT